VTAGADEGFFNVRLTHTQRGHALRELSFLFQADRERAHGRNIRIAPQDGNGPVSDDLIPQIAIAESVTLP
jgi:hypothetical protein